MCDNNTKGNWCDDQTCEASSDCYSGYCNSDKDCRPASEGVQDALDAASDGVAAGIIVLIIILVCICCCIVGCIVCCVMGVGFCAKKGAEAAAA